MTRAFRLLLFLLLFGTLTAAPCPPELATAFDEEVLRAGASPEDILQYEAQVQQERRLPPVRRIEVCSGANAVYTGHAERLVPPDYALV